MTDQHRKQWESLGSSDPYWAVLTRPGMKGGKWDKEEFFQTGDQEIQRAEKKMSSLGIQLKRGTALDYGCGVGRLSRALASRFENVIGMDISETMLKEARTVNASFPNLSFIGNNGRELTDIKDGTIDFIYSNIVLQHSPQENQRLIINEFCRVLSQGGVVAFQTPSHHNLKTAKGLLYVILGNGILNFVRRFLHGKDRVMEMHALHKDEVVELLERGKLSIIAVEEFNSAGDAFIGYMYFASRH